MNCTMMRNDVLKQWLAGIHVYKVYNLHQVKCFGSTALTRKAHLQQRGL